MCYVPHTSHSTYHCCANFVKNACPHVILQKKLHADLALWQIPNFRFKINGIPQTLLSTKFELFFHIIFFCFLDLHLKNVSQLCIFIRFNIIFFLTLIHPHYWYGFYRLLFPKFSYHFFGYLFMWSNQIFSITKVWNRREAHIFSIALIYCSKTIFDFVQAHLRAMGVCCFWARSLRASPTARQSWCGMHELL